MYLVEIEGCAVTTVIVIPVYVEDLLIVDG